MISFCKKIKSFYELVRYRGVVIALFWEKPDDASSILLGKRAYKLIKGLWSFSGGTYESWKTSLQTASR
jgi:8-oxo-dGTP pyrophosphatase MutT (NUDIX family)